MNSLNENQYELSAIDTNGETSESDDNSIQSPNLIGLQFGSIIALKKIRYVLLISVTLCLIILTIVIFVTLTHRQGNLVTTVTLTTSDTTSQTTNTSSMLITSVSTTVITAFMPMLNISVDAQWEQNGITIIEGRQKDNATYRVYQPRGLFIDDDQNILIADHRNHRIDEWKQGDKEVVVLFGGGKGTKLGQLHHPVDVLIDRALNTLIICDQSNRRVLRWFRRSPNKTAEILINNIRCAGLAIDHQRYLYISDNEHHQVKRYDTDGRNQTVVAGTGRQGNASDELNSPAYIFVDRQQNVFVSDTENNRVIQWNKGASVGKIVAGNGIVGRILKKLQQPAGIFVDSSNTVYVADCRNNRVMRWPQGATTGSVVVGNNGQGSGSNQLNCPKGLVFDRTGNLYVADSRNNRIQKYLFK
ncbi:unnamed protein product [Adineta ricciae]|uniref:Uncharacterized protein n=1 Tax=Adineta ricciae TaxID=249248 RepID=A0A814VWU2_ADIRI|nr:unnamed protein product [Adineta ricciae]CAF1461554.1 unnamed protein product [Adineta ricciae]